MGALQFAQVGEQWGDFTASVLVDAMQAHERIEDQQPRRELRDGALQRRAIGRGIEPQRGRGDDLHVQIGELATGGGADALQALAHDVQRILGRVEQHPPRLRHGEVAQARGAGGHRDGEIEGEEALAALGLAPDDAHGLLGPQPGDEPAALLGPRREPPGRLDGERVGVHRRRVAILAGAAVGAAKASKKSCSSMWRASRCAARASNSPAMFMSARGLPWA